MISYVMSAMTLDLYVF